MSEHSSRPSNEATTAVIKVDADAKEQANSLKNEIDWWESTLRCAPGTLRKAPVKEHKEINAMVEPITFAWIMTQVLSGALAWLGSKAMDNVFGNGGSRTNEIFNDITRDIERVVDKRFTEHELAQLEASIKTITGNLRVFNNTPSQARIDEAVGETIRADSYVNSFFKNTRAVLVYRYKVILGTLKIQAHQTRMKYLYDEGVRTNRQDLIAESEGEINNILDVINIYASGYLSECWVEWNASRFSALFKLWAKVWLYAFDSKNYNTWTEKYDEASRVLEKRKEEEFSKLRDEHIVPVVHEFIFPLVRQRFFLEILLDAFKDIKKRRPNYYEIKDFAELVNVNKLSLDASANADWEKADKLIRNKLNASATHVLDEAVSTISLLDSKGVRGVGDEKSRGENTERLSTLSSEPKQPALVAEFARASLNFNQPSPADEKNHILLRATRQLLEKLGAQNFDLYATCAAQLAEYEKPNRVLSYEDSTALQKIHDQLQQALQGLASKEKVGSDTVPSALTS